MDLLKLVLNMVTDCYRIMLEYKGLEIKGDTLVCHLDNEEENSVHHFIISFISGYGQDDHGTYLISDRFSFYVKHTLDDVITMLNQYKKK